MSLYQPKIMGIVNVTPDSFSDGGEFLDPQQAIEHGLRLVADGADILDIGGESTRPGAMPVCVEEEIARVVPVIEGLGKETDVLISIDTRRVAVMEAAIKAGAGMINDVTALTGKGSLAVASAANVPVCLMHMQGEPGTMQHDPQYDDVVEDVHAFLVERVRAAETAGIPKEQIVIDVGIGFGKTLLHNLTLLKNLSRFNDLGAQTMLGASRKSFIEHLNGDSLAPTDRLGGSLAAVAAGVSAKIDIFRVHDVLETKQFIAVSCAVETSH